MWRHPAFVTTQERFGFNLWWNERFLIFLKSLPDCVIFLHHQSLIIYQSSIKMKGLFIPMLLVLIYVLSEVHAAPQFGSVARQFSVFDPFGGQIINNQGCQGSLCNQFNAGGLGSGFNPFRGSTTNNQGCVGSFCNQFNQVNNPAFNPFGGSTTNNQGCVGSRCNQFNLG